MKFEQLKSGQIVKICGRHWPKGDWEYVIVKEDYHTKARTLRCEQLYPTSNIRDTEILSSDYIEKLTDEEKIKLL